MELNNIILFVIGMHRCGTSLLTNCLVENGFDIGITKNKDKNWQNPKGYFENDSFTSFHDSLLKYNNSSWHSITRDEMIYTEDHINEYKNLINKEFTTCNKILIKDPRLTFFQSFLKKVCKNNYNYKFIFCTRDKVECCSSLAKAQNLAYLKCEALYDTTHNYLSSDNIIINHNDIIFNNSEVINTIFTKCGLASVKDTSSLVDLNLYRNKNV